jgi:hypothetical protein
MEDLNKRVETLLMDLKDRNVETISKETRLKDEEISETEEFSGGYSESNRCGHGTRTDYYIVHRWKTVNIKRSIKAESARKQLLVLIEELEEEGYLEVGKKVEMALAKYGRRRWKGECSVRTEKHLNYDKP